MIVVMQLIFFWFLIWPSGGSSYNLWTSTVTCDNRGDCLHEMAHMMDDDAGWISESDEYKMAVATYRSVAWSCEECRDEFSDLVMFFPGVGGPLQEEKDFFSRGYWHGGWGGYRELYAVMYAEAGGDVERMPELFRPFYEIDEEVKNAR